MYGWSTNSRWCEFESYNAGILLAWLEPSLFAVTLVPFSTLLLAHYYWLKVALIEYWLNIVLLGATLLSSLEYGLRADLFQEEDRPTWRT